MRSSWFRAWVSGLALLVLPGLLAADPFGRFQHGGRGVAQAGAFIARADDPLAVTYNPAGLVRVEGWQLVAGLDFDAPSDTLESGEGDSRPNHSIQFPPLAYLAHRPEGSRWAVGLGVDSPIWRLTDWNTALFPARFTARKADLRLFAARIVGAIALDESWSAGAGVRYLFGRAGFQDTLPGFVTLPSGTYAFEADRSLEVGASGWGLDFGVQFRGEGWGFGATYRSATEVEGSDRLRYVIRDEAALPPEAREQARAGLLEVPAQLFEELPEQLAAGLYWAPYPELIVELDGAFERWGATRHGAEVPGGVVGLERRNRWRDILSFRLGLEGALWDSGWKLGGGLAWAPSPVRSSSVEPGTARSDARIYSLGATYQLEPRLCFELGYSFHDHRDLRAERQIRTGDGSATYRSHSQIFSVSARWRW